MTEPEGATSGQSTSEEEMLWGGELLIRSLEAEGVDVLFGYPGGAALHIYDALFHSKQLNHILVRHEQAAVHAADGYARATGRVGAVLVTSGPGATNAITGIATAYSDSIPLVIISGQVQSHLIGTDAFQETDMIGISRPVVKHSYLVTKTEDIPTTMRMAFHLASSGRPGPVVVDIPKDITAPGKTYPFAYPESIHMRSYQPSVRPHQRQIRLAAKALLAARKPVILAGGGVISSESSAELRKLAELLRIPVSPTLMGLGSIPGEHQLCLGMPGMHGTYEANMAIHHCDLLLAVGARLDDRVTNTPEKFAPDAKLVHIDIDPATISKIIPASIPIVGDCKKALQALIAECESLMTATTEGSALAEERAKHLNDWHERVNLWREKHGLNHSLYARVPDSDGLPLPQQVLQWLYQMTRDEDAWVTSDVGQHQMFAAQYYHFDSPRRWINSGGLGTMGFGLPAAMGVQLAHPDSLVACVTGEGSIQMCIQELSTCLQYGLPIKIINVNNEALGMVKQWQDMQYSGRYSQVRYQNSLPDFKALAEAYGHVGIRVEKTSELEDAMRETVSLRDRLVFLDVLVDPEEHVYPMHIAPNGAMKDMWLSKTERT